MAKSLTCSGFVYAILVLSITLGCVIAALLNYNAALERNYHWPAENIGIINVAPIPASFLAIIVVGWGSDRTTVFMAKRNNGIAIPEHRLIPPSSFL